MIEQAARGGHDDVGAVLQGAGLRFHADAAVHRGALQVGVAPVGADTRHDLLGELTGRHEDQRAQHAACPGLEALQDRQHERRRLPGAGLGGPDQIAAREGQRDRFRLDGGGLLVTFIGYGTHELGREAQGCEWHNTPLLHTHARREVTQCHLDQALLLFWNLGKGPCVCSATESLSGTIRGDASSRFYATGGNLTTCTAEW